jgi:hypothetical protein
MATTTQGEAAMNTTQTAAKSLCWTPLNIGNAHYHSCGNYLVTRVTSSIDMIDTYIVSDLERDGGPPVLTTQDYGVVRSYLIANA